MFDDIPETLTKIIEGPPDTEPPEGEMVLADFGEEEGKRYFLAAEGLSEEDIDRLELYPSDLCELLQTAVEVASAPRPDSQDQWEGVSLMIVSSEAIVAGETGWVCKNCNFVVGGSAPSPPETCPGCAPG